MLVPIRVDVPRDRRPIVNWLLMIALAGLATVQAADPAMLKILRQGTVEFNPRTGEIRTGPDDTGEGATALRRLVLPGGTIHLLGSLPFLWLFGNAVNARFGHGWYLLLWTVSAGAAGAVFWQADGRFAAGGPAAINGIMAAFLVYYPRNDVTAAWSAFFRGGRVTVPSGLVIALWVAWDGLFLLIAGAGSWQAAAHMVAFVTGLAVALTLLLSRLVRPGPDEQPITELLRR